jgi:hypothetical protein
MENINCPMCFNSSGLTLFMGDGRSQVCNHCGGKGKVSIFKYHRLKAQYEGLIPALLKSEQNPEPSVATKAK